MTSYIQATQREKAERDVKDKELQRQLIQATTAKERAETERTTATSNAERVKVYHIMTLCLYVYSVVYTTWLHRSMLHVFMTGGQH